MATQRRFAVMGENLFKVATKLVNNQRLCRLLKYQDTNPFSEEEEIKECADVLVTEKAKKSKAKMSWWTAFKLSLTNLFTKKGRTILTSFAGSIGIIGIALILAISSGFSGYVDKMQKDTLGSYPISISNK